MSKLMVGILMRTLAFVQIKIEKSFLGRIGIYIVLNLHCYSDPYISLSVV